MRILIDRDDLGGQHFIELDISPKNKVSSPLTGAEIDALEFLKLLNQDIGLHAATGWNAVTQLPGYPPGTTRWGVFATEINKPEVPQELRDLNFVVTPPSGGYAPQPSQAQTDKATARLRLKTLASKGGKNLTQQDRDELLCLRTLMELGEL